MQGLFKICVNQKGGRGMRVSEEVTSDDKGNEVQPKPWFQSPKHFYTYISVTQFFLISHVVLIILPKETVKTSKGLSASLK